MKTSTRTLLGIASPLLLASVLVCSDTLAQTRVTPPTFGQGPRVAQGLPGIASGEPAPPGPPALAPAKVHALTGAWSITKSVKTTPVPPKGALPLTPAYEARRAELERMDTSGEVIPGRNAKCIPSGLPDMMAFGFRLEANAEYMTMIAGTGPTIRLIWLNRKAHTPNRLLFASYGGEAIAHWEGNTLVVDTIGLDPTNEITYALPVNDENMHIVERFTLRSPTELEVVTTIESSLALAKPWTYTNIYGRRTVTEGIMYCDRPSVNDSLDLTPPADGYIPPDADK